MIDIQSLVITEPTSANEILNRVILLIEDEPKRMHMGYWYVTKESDPDLFDYFVRYETAPSCGTTACMAGWMGYVAGNYFPKEKGMGIEYPSVIAHMIAGFNPRAESDLCRSFLGRPLMHYPDGSPKQTVAVATYLRDFQTIWAEHLQNRMILPGGGVQ